MKDERGDSWVLRNCTRFFSFSTKMMHTYGFSVKGSIEHTVRAIWPIMDDGEEGIVVAQVWPSDLISYPFLSHIAREFFLASCQFENMNVAEFEINIETGQVDIIMVNSINEGRAFPMECLVPLMKAVRFELEVVQERLKKED